MLYGWRPGMPLSQFVEQLWYCDGYQAAHRRERVLPTGTFQLIVDLASPMAVVAGMRSRYVVIETAALSSILGVVFRPGGARRFFGAPADRFFNQEIGLDDVWHGVAGLRERLQAEATADGKLRVLEGELAGRMSAVADPHPAVRYALAEFRRAPHVARVQEITREAGLSRRRFSELFREQVGLTPKLYCRVRRFRGVVRRAAAGAEIDWADLAIAGGYCDQAHLAHEFRDFSGLTPSEYAAADRPSTNHVPME
jgi:AraC-like DNA-binding protein